MKKPVTLPTGKWLLIVGILTIVIAQGCTSGAADAETRNRIAVSTAVHVAATGLGGILKDVSDEGRQVEIIRTFIDPVRFLEDKTGYFYVYRYNCVNVAHAVDKSLPGKDLSTMQDSRGLYVIRELSKTARKGGGYVDYLWPRPDTKKEAKKVGYVEPIPGTDYFIGSGYYPPPQ